MEQEEQHRKIGRPSKPKTEKLKLAGSYVPPELHDLLKEAAMKEKRSFSAQIKYVLDEWAKSYLKQLERSKRN